MEYERVGNIIQLEEFIKKVNLFDNGNEYPFKFQLVGEKDNTPEKTKKSENWKTMKMMKRVKALKRYRIVKMLEKMKRLKKH